MAGCAGSSGSRGRGGPWRAAAWGGAALLLLAPLAAMRLTEEVRWSGPDFAAFGAMLAAALAALELAARATRSAAYRAAAAVALGASFLMAWINLAVGIIGGEDDPRNAVFSGVLAIGVVGACVARFRPRGLARALAAMGVAQVLVAVAALVGGHPGVVLTVPFAAAWLVSARLFRRAAEDRAAPWAAG